MHLVAILTHLLLPLVRSLSSVKRQWEQCQITDVSLFEGAPQQFWIQTPLIPLQEKPRVFETFP